MPLVRSWHRIQNHTRGQCTRQALGWADPAGLMGLTVRVTCPALPCACATLGDRRACVCVGGGGPVCARACVRACASACVLVCARACMCVCVCPIPHPPDLTPSSPPPSSPSAGPLISVLYVFYDCLCEGGERAQPPHVPGQLILVPVLVHLVHSRLKPRQAGRQAHAGRPQAHMQAGRQAQAGRPQAHVQATRHMPQAGLEHMHTQHTCRP